MPRGQGGASRGSAGGVSEPSESSETITYEEAVRTGQIGRYTRGMAPELWTKKEKEEAVFIKEPIKGKVVTEKPEETEEKKIVIAKKTGGDFVTTTEAETQRRFGEYEAVITPEMVSEEGEVRGARVRTPQGWVSQQFPARPSIRKPADSGEILIEKRIPILPKKREEFEGIPSISEKERRLTEGEMQNFFRRLVGQPTGKAVTKVTGSEKAGYHTRETLSYYLSYPSQHPVRAGVFYGTAVGMAVASPFIAGASLFTKLVLGTATIVGSGVSGFTLGAEAKRAEEERIKYGLTTGGAGKVFGEFLSDVSFMGAGLLHGSYLTKYTTPALKRFTKAGKAERAYMKSITEEYGDPLLKKGVDAPTVKQFTAEYGEPLKSDVPFIGKLQPYTSPTIKQFTAEYGKSVFGRLKQPKVPPSLGLPRRTDFPRATASERAELLKGRADLRRYTQSTYSGSGGEPFSVRKIEGGGLDDDVVRELSKGYRLENLRSESSALQSDLVSARNKAWTARQDLMSSLEKQYTMKVVYDPGTGRTTIRPVLKPSVTQLYTPSGEPAGFTVPKPPKVPIKKIGLYEILGKPTTRPPSWGVTTKVSTSLSQRMGAGMSIKSVSIAGESPLDSLTGMTRVTRTAPSFKYTVLKKAPARVDVSMKNLPPSFKAIFFPVTKPSEETTLSQFKEVETKQITKTKQSQELILLQDQKLDQAQYQKIAQSLSSALGQRQDQSQAQRQKQKQKQMYKQVQAMGTPTMPMSVQASALTQAQKQAQKQAQEEIFETPTVLITEQVEPRKPRKPRKPRQTYGDYIPTEPIPVKKPGWFAFPDFEFPESKPRKPPKFIIPKRKQKYTPTLVSDYLGVSLRTTPSKRVYRGLEVRPIITKKQLEKPMSLKQFKKLI